MPYVPVPQGATTLSVRDDVKVPFQRVTNGKVTTGVRVVAAVGNRLAYGQVTRQKGKPTTVGGQKWSPCRSYFRYADVMTPLPGPSVTKQGDTVTTFHGLSDLVTNYDTVAMRSKILDVAWTTQMRNRVNTELLVKVGQRKVNYGEAIAEGRETISHLAKTTSTVVRALLAARRGQWSRVPKILGVPKKKLRDGASASEKWLEYQYGWLPLLGDINDSYELFKKGLTRGPQIFSAVRNIRETIDESSTLNKSQNFADCFGRTEICHTGKIFFRIPDSDLSALHQLGLINPLEVAWAIVPYSFVVDWFLPVGSVLEAVSARFGVTFVDGYYGRRVKSHYSSKEKFSATLKKLVSSAPVCDTDTFAYRREKMSTMPWPGFYVKSPFSTSHVTSALALLRQLWR